MNSRLLVPLFLLSFCLYSFADFDNNLKSDLFVVESSGSTTVLGWYENTGCLREIILKEHIVLDDISAVATGDFNHNSLTDIMIGTIGSSSCRWYEFSPDSQTLNYVASLSLIGEVVDMSIGDFDGDNYGDLIVTSSSSACLWYEWDSGTNAVLRGNLKKGGKAAAIGDLNDNGIPDVLLAYSTGLQLVESTGNNTWTLLAGCSWPWGVTTTNIKSIAVGDVDGDSETHDFVYIYKKDTVKTGELMWRAYSIHVNGDPAIFWKATFNDFADFETVRLGDIDGDGSNEIIASRSNGEVVFITAVEGGKLEEVSFSGSIDSATQGDIVAISPSSVRPVQEPVACKEDMIVVGGQGSAAWFQSTGFPGKIDYIGEVYDDATSVTLGDFDHDDKLDLFVSKNAAEGGWYEASGAFKRFMPVLSIGSGTVPNGLAVGDFDGDGKGDLFNCVSWGNCYWYTSDSNNAKRTVKTITNDALACSLGDVDGDADMDLLVSTSTGLKWFESNGIAEQHVSRMTAPELAGALTVAVGDIDGDMYKDIFVVKQDGTVVWLEGRFDNELPVLVGGVIASDASSVAIGDVDGDGSSELLITDTGGVLRWYRSAVNDSVTSVTGMLCGVNAIDIAINKSSLDFSFDCEVIEEDFNGDCYVDIVDLEIFSQRWLESFIGELYDYPLFSELAGNWTDCSDPTNLSCVLTEDKQAFIHMDFADEVQWAGNLGYATYKEAEIAEFFARCKDRGIDGVFWRITAGGKVLHWSNVASVFPARINPELLTESDLKLADVMADIDPLALAVQYAHLNGVKLFVWLRVSDENGADPQQPYARATDIILDRPEYALLDRQGNPMAGTVCYNEPGVRANKLAHITELVNNYDLDGVLLCTRTHAFYHNEDSGYQYGYNPPVVAEYQRLYGVDILTEDFDYQKWLDIRAQGMSLFVEQASQIVHNAGMKLWFGAKTAANEKRGWPYGEAIQPWKSWLSNDWIDGIVAGHYYTPPEQIETQTKSFDEVAKADQTMIFLIQLYDFNTNLNTPLSDIETIIQTISTSNSHGGSFYEALQLEDNINSYWNPIYDNVDEYWHLNFK